MVRGYPEEDDVGRECKLALGRVPGEYHKKWAVAGEYPATL